MVLPAATITNGAAAPPVTTIAATPITTVPTAAAKSHAPFSALASASASLVSMYSLAAMMSSLLPL
jgi:hypothetical protein